jgi:quinol monooxygenase YgiN
MSVVVVVTALPLPECREQVVAAFEAAIARVHDEPGVELYALHEGRHRLVMIEKYASEQARSEHLKGAALAELRAALDGTLSTGLEAQSSHRTQPDLRRRARYDSAGRRPRTIG